MDENYQEVISFDRIYKSFQYARKGSFWKDSIIEYDLNRLFHSVRISRALQADKYKLKGYYKFTICERDKIRHIQSLHITDRVYQRALCDVILIPEMSRSFILDNSASQVGKGTVFARNRLKLHMQRFYRKHGLDGYVLQIDIRKYFDNISHDYLKQRMDHYFKDRPRLLKEMYAIIDSFDGDRGIGLGSQVCQLFALDVLNSFDHYVKDVLQIKYYGRYMDDMYLIHHDKEYLIHCKKELSKRLEVIGLQLHPKKTQLFPIKKGIRFLGFHFYLTETGGTVVKLLGKSEKRMKRKLRKMVYKGLPKDAIYRSFNSWKGHASYGDTYYKVKRMEDYINKLIEEHYTAEG